MTHRSPPRTKMVIYKVVVMTKVTTKDENGL